MTRLAVITKGKVVILDGRKSVAEFEIEAPLSRDDIEFARVADYGLPPFATYPRFGSAGQARSYSVVNGRDGKEA